MKDIDVVDLFDEEINKKKKNIDKKVEKARLKEERKKEKEAKRLEKIEDIEFNEYLKNLKKEQLIERDVEIPANVPVKNGVKTVPDHINIDSVEKKLKENNIETIEKKLDIQVEKQPKKHPFLNFLLVLCSICLLVITTDYMVYNSITHYSDLKTLINSILLTVMVACYLISILVKNEGAKKFFQILSMLAIIGFMSYHLFIA